MHYVGPGRYFCEPCLARLDSAPQMPFDVIVDRWTARLGDLQAVGELIAVRLPRGFFGVCLLADGSGLDAARRPGRRR